MNETDNIEFDGDDDVTGDVDDANVEAPTPNVEAPTRVYQSRAFFHGKGTAGEHACLDEIYRAHRYYNEGVKIHQARYDQYNDMYRRECPEMLSIEQKIQVINSRLDPMFERIRELKSTYCFENSTPLTADLKKPAGSKKPKKRKLNKTLSPFTAEYVQEMKSLCADTKVLETERETLWDQYKALKKTNAPVFKPYWDEIRQDTNQKLSNLHKTTEVLGDSGPFASSGTYNKVRNSLATASKHGPPNERFGFSRGSIVIQMTASDRYDTDEFKVDGCPHYKGKNQHKIKNAALRSHYAPEDCPNCDGGRRAPLGLPVRALFGDDPRIQIIPLKNDMHLLSVDAQRALRDEQPKGEEGSCVGPSRRKWRRATQYTTLLWRLGSTTRNIVTTTKRGVEKTKVKREPRFVSLGLLMSRPMPLDGIVKYVELHAEKTPFNEYVWHLNITVASAEHLPKKAQGKGVLAIDLGMGRRIEEGDKQVHSRVAVGVDDRGNRIEFIVPKRVSEDLEYCERLVSTRTQDFNTTMCLVADYIDSLSDAPEFLSAERAVMKSWTKTGHGLRLLRAWEQSRIVGDDAIIDALRAWAARRNHLLATEQNIRDNAFALRNEAYRLCWSKIAQTYAHVVWEDPEELKCNDPLFVAKNKQNEGLLSEGKAKHRAQNRAAPGGFREIGKQMCYKHGVGLHAAPPGKSKAAPHGTSRTCSGCGAHANWTDAKALNHTCACGRAFDRDVNACENLLKWYFSQLSSGPVLARTPSSLADGKEMISMYNFVGMKEARPRQAKTKTNRSKRAT